MSNYNDVGIHSAMTEDDDIANLKAQIALMQQGVNEDDTTVGNSTFHSPYAPSSAVTEPSIASSTAVSSVIVTPEKEEADRRSVHVAQVDYSTTADQLQAHFSTCGAINRVNIMVDKRTHQPKGFAYIEFNAIEAAQAALTLNDTVLNGRQIKVSPKRTNIPGLSSSRGRGRGRGGSGYMTPYGAPYYPYPYPPPPFGTPYTPYPYPPPPAAPYYGPTPTAGQSFHHPTGAYRRGGRGGGHRYNPYGAPERRGGRGRGRGHYHNQGDRDDAFVPDDNSQLPRHDQHGPPQPYGTSSSGSYPVEEPASGHY